MGNQTGGLKIYCGDIVLLIKYLITIINIIFCYPKEEMMDD